MSGGRSAPDVSVLVPVLNEGPHIRDTVASMLSQQLDGLTFELVFADGRSDDDTKAILQQIAQQDQRVVVVDNPARTTAIGLNTCLRTARGRYVARMDAHSYFPPRYLAAGIERLQRGDDVVWVAGPVLPRGTGRWSRRVGLALGSRLGIGGSQKWEPNGHAVAPGTPPPEFELDTGVFAGVWERSTLERLGGWDDGWPVNQDSELAARVREQGGRIVCLPEMAAEYLPRDDLRKLWRQYRRFGYYRAKTNARHPGSLRPSHLLAPGLVLTATLAVRSPRRVRRLARTGIALYAGALAAETAQLAQRESPEVAAGMPAVFATLHLSWGLGFLAGLVRFGGLPGLARTLVRRGR
jgi:succinoglycan biosynthesis protein ExoA